MFQSPFPKSSPIPVRVKKKKKPSPKIAGFLKGKKKYKAAHKNL